MYYHDAGDVWIVCGAHDLECGVRYFLGHDKKFQKEKNVMSFFDPIDPLDPLDPKHGWKILLVFVIIGIITTTFVSLFRFGLKPWGR